MQCPSCNTELPKKAKVCPKCGTAIGKPKGNLRGYHWICCNAYCKSFTNGTVRRED